MSGPEPAPEGAVWVVRDPDGRIVDYSAEPMVLEMTTQLGDQFEAAGQALLDQAAKTREG